MTKEVRTIASELPYPLASISTTPPYFAHPDGFARGGWGLSVNSASNPLGWAVNPPLGVTGYLLYTYASYAFLTAFNELYLVYVALFALTLFTLVGGIARIDPTDLKKALDGHPVRGYVAF